MKSKQEISKFNRSINQTTFQPIKYKYIKVDTRSKIQKFLNGNNNGIKMYPKMEMQNNTEYRNSFSHSSRPLTKSDFKNGRNIEKLFATSMTGTLGSLIPDPTVISKLIFKSNNMKSTHCRNPSITNQNEVDCKKNMSKTLEF